MQCVTIYSTKAECISQVLHELLLEFLISVIGWEKEHVLWLEVCN